MNDACSRHLGRVQEYINRLEERNDGLRAALMGVAAALGYGDGETLRPEELADRVSELRDVVERQAATLSRKCGTTHRYPTEGELSPEMRARLMPEGMNWPRFEDGEPVRMGDEVVSRDDDGSPMTMRVGIVRISGVRSGCTTTTASGSRAKGVTARFVAPRPPTPTRRALRTAGAPLGRRVGRCLWLLRALREGADCPEGDSPRRLRRPDGPRRRAPRPGAGG